MIEIYYPSSMPDTCRQNWVCDRFEPSAISYTGGNTYPTQVDILKHDRIRNFNGWTVERGAEHVMKELETGWMLYAGDPARGEYRGFAALGDLCDHNMLYPFADNVEPFQGDESEHSETWNEYTDYCNLVANEFNRRIAEQFDALPSRSGQWVKEFGRGWDVPQRISELFEDISWNQDMCPMFTHKGSYKDGQYPYTLQVDHPAKEAREVEEGSKRFLIWSYITEQTLLETDNEEEAIAKFLQLGLAK